MKNKLTITQRIFATILYLGIFLSACRYFSGQWIFLTDANSNYNLLFISGALLLIFGTYITEPFFTKPVDVITNSIAIILALQSVKDPSLFTGYKFLFYSSAILCSSSIFLIFLSQTAKVEKLQKAFFELITKLGQSKIIFSSIYLLTIYSYFKNQPVEYVAFISFWAVFISQYIVEDFIIFSSKILKFLSAKKNDHEIIGEAIGCENPFLYNIEIDYKKHRPSNTKKGNLVYLSLENSQGAVGIIINEKQLLNKKWLTVYLLSEQNNPLKIDLKSNEFIHESKTIYSKNNSVYKIDLDVITDSEHKGIVEKNYLYTNRKNFIGYITVGSDINKIKFHSLLDASNENYKLLKEGSVVKTEIYRSDVLYQVIDGKTNEEELEKHNTYGYLTGTAQKLGKYNTEKEELEVVKWLPDIYAPVFFDDTKAEDTKALTIGKLPETNLGIVIKDLDALITHNTSILGILGIGKSCLTFELIQKTLGNLPDIKIVCIDITNQYKADLKKYIEESLLREELTDATLKELKDGNKTGTADNPTSWGNEQLYKDKLDEDFKSFCESDKRILTLNPDWHSVSKAGSQFKIQHKVDLTIAEKTRIISERLFMLAKKLCEEKGIEEQRLNKAKFLLVFEEAHSLIPEWNSTANPGDQSASNGTAKVILQGRKYGFGSFVITQRTANISKSILNQCNTIFALRVFDDTGKQFLENYIGRDYSNTLPTLDERHSIVVGKALKLKQPVIVRLNDMEDVII